MKKNVKQFNVIPCHSLRSRCKANPDFLKYGIAGSRRALRFCLDVHKSADIIGYQQKNTTHLEMAGVLLGLNDEEIIVLDEPCLGQALKNFDYPTAKAEMTDPGFRRLVRAHAQELAQEKSETTAANDQKKAAILAGSC